MIGNEAGAEICLRESELYDPPLILHIPVCPRNISKCYFSIWGRSIYSSKPGTNPRPHLTVKNSVRRETYSLEHCWDGSATKRNTNPAKARQRVEANKISSVHSRSNNGTVSLQGERKIEIFLLLHSDAFPAAVLCIFFRQS